LRTLIAFLTFCIISGVAYIINDIADVERDREHPKKRNRPIASGKLGVKEAAISAIILALGSLAASFYLNLFLGLIVLAYFLLNLSYSFCLKNIIIIDVFIIASGFVFRAIAGAAAIQVKISPWLVISTLFLALFLALSKRRAELTLLAKEAPGHRSILREYSFSLLDQMIMVTSTVSIVSYALYTFGSVHSDKLMWTIPFVVYGIFRYMYLINQKGKGGSLEEILFNDKPFLINIILWLATVGFILLYFSS
jgi:4-hydroxybenzoate polyprenyltransferase